MPRCDHLIFLLMSGTRSSSFPSSITLCRCLLALGLVFLALGIAFFDVRFPPPFIVLLAMRTFFFVCSSCGAAGGGGDPSSSQEFARPRIWLPVRRIVFAEITLRGWSSMSEFGTPSIPKRSSAVSYRVSATFLSDPGMSMSACRRMANGKIKILRVLLLLAATTIIIEKTMCIWHLIIIIYYYNNNLNYYFLFYYYIINKVVVIK